MYRFPYRTPVCVDSFFYNAKYGSFPIAGQKMDGILIIRESVKVTVTLHIQSFIC